MRSKIPVTSCCQLSRERWDNRDRRSCISILNRALALRGNRRSCAKNGEIEIHDSNDRSRIQGGNKRVQSHRWGCAEKNERQMLIGAPQAKSVQGVLHTVDSLGVPRQLPQQKSQECLAMHFRRLQIERQVDRGRYVGCAVSISHSVFMFYKKEQKP